MKDPSFLICGEWIIETGHFSLLTSLLGCLYHLIIWHGGFNSRPGPVYFGMGRISLLVKLLYWVPLKSLHKVDVWAYVLSLRSGLVHILFLTPSYTMKKVWVKS